MQNRKYIRERTRKEVAIYLTMATQFTHMSFELYNLKVIQYGNGTVEFRKYDNVVNQQLYQIDEDLAFEKSMKNIENDICKPELVYNPFTDKEEKLFEIEQYQILQDRKERNKKRSLDVSLSRSVNAVYKYSRQCVWEYFITLTFDSYSVDRIDLSACMKKANKWFNNQKNRFAPELQYLFVPEEHKLGGWHIHGLIANVGEMKFDDSGHKTRTGQIVYNLGGWKFGFSTATIVTDTHRVSSYITKYITKDLCSKTSGQRRYYRSRNIPEPIETNYLVDGNQRDIYIDMIADSLGVEIDYDKFVSGYIDINYKFYK